uniref:Uncharacterized protein n=1 Tax=Anopheles farauti TaxID=69004 RepID=A0A182QNJ5_9DIPT
MVVVEDSLACVVSTSNSEPWELWRWEPAEPSEGGWLPEPVEPELEVRASRLAPLGWRAKLGEMGGAILASLPVRFGGGTSCEPPLSFDTIVFGVVVEFESDSFSKLPCSARSGRTTRCTSLRVFGLNSNSESRLKLGELRSDRLEEVDSAESCCSTWLGSRGCGCIPSGKRNELGGRYTSRGSRFDDRLGDRSDETISDTKSLSDENATFDGVSDHSASHSTAWVRANRLRKADVRGRDRRKLLIWKATTGRGYSRRMRVCSVKFASVFCELKNRTMATRVATSTESTSAPKMSGLVVAAPATTAGWLPTGLGCCETAAELAAGTPVLPWPLFGAAHARRQERYDREHVLERVDEMHERHHGHREGVVVARLDDHLVLEQYERQHSQTGVDSEQLQRQVKREVDHREARVVGKGEHERLVEGRRQDVHLDAGRPRHRDRRREQPQDPGFDLLHVVQDDGAGRLRRLTLSRTDGRAAPTRFGLHDSLQASISRFRMNRHSRKIDRNGWCERMHSEVSEWLRIFERLREARGEGEWLPPDSESPDGPTTPSREQEHLWVSSKFGRLPAQGGVRWLLLLLLLLAGCTARPDAHPRQRLLDRPVEVDADAVPRLARVLVGEREHKRGGVANGGSRTA